MIVGASSDLLDEVKFEGVAIHINLVLCEAIIHSLLQC
jgi:hypothetical protein